MIGIHRACGNHSRSFDGILAKLSFNPRSQETPP